MIELKSIFSHRRDGAIVFEECLDRSFIEDRDGLIVTAAGEALARGKASPRTPLAKALQVLDDFLTRVDAMNSDDEAVRYVEEVWLFGSVLRQAETVGDIDLAIATRRRPKYAGKSGYNRMLSHLHKLFADRDDVPLNPPLYWLPDFWHMRRALFGAQRHRLLAVKEDMDELADLGVPCRLIYDRSRGGRVDAPMLARHPTSKGRLNDIDPPAEFPDLTPTQLRPMDARWLSSFEPWGSVVVVPQHVV